jgi:hypothetical protein
MSNTTAKQASPANSTSLGSPIVITTSNPSSNINVEISYRFKFDIAADKYHLAQNDVIKFIEVLKNPPVANDSLRQLIATFVAK